MKLDILIKNALVVTVGGGKKDTFKGFVGIKDDMIEYVGAKKPDGTASTTIDVKGGIVMPGLINAHTHSPMSIYRGMADDMALFEWLNKHIWPAEKEFVTEENIALASDLSIAEMIRSGTTTFNDMYFFSNITEQSALSAGIRAMVGEALLDIPSPVYKISESYWKERAKMKGDNTLINISIVPHSPYTCSKKILKKTRAVSKKYGAIIHTHISETQNEVDQIRKEHGMTPVEYLDSINFLNENTIAVHCVVLSDGDIDILAKRKVGIVHCPQSNLKLASGIARIGDLKKAGLTVALGTDGPASNNTLDMFSEMKTAALIHKGVSGDPTLLSAKEVVEMATINGAKALGLDHITGSIKKGKKADIIIIDTDKLHLTPMYDPYSHIVYSVKGSDVETVIINGKIVMRNRKLLTINEKELKFKANELSKKIISFKSSGGKK